MFRFDAKYLEGKLAGDYANASPYPHIVIDDFLPQEIFDAVAGDIPSSEEVTIRNNLDTKGKSAVYHSEGIELPDNVYNYISEMNSATMLKAVTRLTGIDALIPDPYVYCGGIHQTRRGGYLGIHADYTYLAELRLDRRLNMIFYLNDEWDESWGGHLGLWSRDLKSQAQRVAPKANRLVVMNTDATSWHGHPDPLDCPPDRTRNSIAIYYYTAGRPKGEVPYRDLSTRYEVEGGRRHGFAALKFEAKHFVKNWKRLRKAKIT